MKSMGVTDGCDGVASGILDAELFFFENWLDLEGDRLGCFVYTPNPVARLEYGPKI